MEKKNMSRAEAYAEVKRLGLQDECKKKFGKNFTQCSTNDLVSLVDSANKKAAKKAAPAPAVVENPVVEPTPVVEETNTEATHCNCGCDSVRKALKSLVEALYSSNIIDNEAYEEVKTLLDDKEYKAPKKMSKSEIDEMFSFVKK